MGSVSGQGPFDPKDLEYYAPRRLRERLGARRSQGARLESITRPVSPLPGFDGQPKSAGSVSLRNPLSPEVFREPAGPARETDPQASLFRPAARFAIATSVAVAAAVIGVAAVAALLFFLMAPAPRQS